MAGFGKEDAHKRGRAPSTSGSNTYGVPENWDNSDMDESSDDDDDNAPEAPSITPSHPRLCASALIDLTDNEHLVSSAPGSNSSQPIDLSTPPPIVPPTINGKDDQTLDEPNNAVSSVGEPSITTNTAQLDVCDDEDGMKDVVEDDPAESLAMNTTVDTIQNNDRTIQSDSYQAEEGHCDEEHEFAYMSELPPFQSEDDSDNDSEGESDSDDDLEADRLSEDDNLSEASSGPIFLNSDEEEENMDSIMGSDSDSEIANADTEDMDHISSDASVDYSSGWSVDDSSEMDEFEKEEMDEFEREEVDEDEVIDEGKNCPICTPEKLTNNSIGDFDQTFSAVDKPSIGNITERRMSALPAMPVDKQYERMEASPSDYSAPQDCAFGCTADVLGPKTGKHEFFQARAENKASISWFRQVSQLGDATEPAGPWAYFVPSPIKPTFEPSTYTTSGSPPKPIVRLPSWSEYTPAEYTPSVTSHMGLSEPILRRTHVGIADIVDNCQTSPEPPSAKRKAERISDISQADESWARNQAGVEAVNPVILVAEHSPASAHSEVQDAPVTRDVKDISSSSRTITAEAITQTLETAIVPPSFIFNPEFTEPVQQLDVVVEKPAATPSVDPSSHPNKRRRLHHLAERLGYAALGGLTVGTMVLGSLIYTAPSLA
jgi:hypothetical protein